MTTSARAVADELRRRIPGVGTAKLHKLLYYAQGHHVADLGQPLFRDTISAWDMGPVVGSLWYAEQNDATRPEPQLAPLDEAELNTTAYVVSRYGGLSGNDLIRLSHSEPPWLDANARRPAGMSVRIELEAIREHFVRLADEDDEEHLDAEMLRRFLASADPARALAPPAHPDSIEEIAVRLAALAG